MKRTVESKEQRVYSTPRLSRYGKVEDVTRTGNGTGKESGNNKRPVTFSNP